MSLALLLAFAPAFAAGLLVIATHVPLGREVLRSGIIFLDLAIAQAAALGVVVATTIDHEEAGGPTTQFAAAAAALVAAALLSWTEKWAAALQEALIGSLFAICASAGIIVLAGNPHGAEHLRDLLVGQILWVTWADLIPVAALYAAILAAWFGLGRDRLGRIGFYVLFALAVTASVQLVGVYLVFATLILPALAVHRCGGFRAAAAGYAVAGTGYALGFALSAALDLPAGAVIVGTVAICALGGFKILRRRRSPAP